MVDTIKELSDLSRKLNQKSDTLNDVITSVNQKLAKLSLGVEAWVSNIKKGDPYDYEREDLPQSIRVHDETWLGYCRLEEGWELAVKTVVLYEMDETTILATAPMPLLKKSRNIRALAMKLIPELLDAIKDKAEELLDSINEAEKAAEKL